MIEGLKITLSSDELRRHLEDIADVHGTKVNLYAQQVATLEQAGEQANEHVSADPISGLRDKMREHSEKRDYFDFLAKHVIPDEDYLLSESDLRSLEIIRRFF